MNVYHSRLGMPAEALNTDLSQAGFKPLAIAVYQIQKGCDFPQLAHFNETPECAIVTSRHAVDQLLAGLPVHSLNRLKHLPVAAIGSATANYLREFGFNQVIQPQQDTSEGLLEMPEIKQRTHFVLFKGERGRDKIAQTMQLAKKKLTTYNVYKRHWVSLSAEQAKRIAQADIFLLTSGEIALHLHHQLSTYGYSIRNKVCLVPSQRVQGLLQQEGYNQVENLKSAANSAIMHYLKSLKGHADE